MSPKALILVLFTTYAAFVALVSYFSIMAALSLTVIAVLVQGACLPTTLYLHRYVTHAGITYLHPRIVHGCKFVIWMFTGIDWQQWAAVHLKHHAFTDEEGDPHSPYLLGWVWVQLFNVVEYAKEARNPETIRRYASHITRHDGIWGRFPFSVSMMGPAIGLGILSVFMGALWVLTTPGPQGWGETAMMGMAWGIPTGLIHGFTYIMLSGSVNSLCHWFGYKNFDNTATNIPLVAILTCGEGNHNNHHGYPRSSKFSAKPGEVDPAFILLRWWVRMGWAQVYESAIVSMEAKAAQVQRTA